jgi:cytochrome c556
MFKREWTKHFVTVATTAVIASAAAVALAAASPKDTIKLRQEGLKDLGAQMKVINDTLKTSAPDAAKIKEAAAKVKKHSAEISTWFPAGSGPEAGVETAAKPEIWKDAADFTAKGNAFVAEADKLATVADSGDVEGVRNQVRAVGKSCGGCHERYRVKKEG